MFDVKGANDIKLLTPGPLTTTKRVGELILKDRCSWDDAYKQMTQQIRGDLLQLANVSEEEYTTVLMQGSGSFVVESVLTSAIKPTDTLLIITNGAYGKRMVEMADVLGLSYIELAFDFDEVPRLEVIMSTLEVNERITHVAVVHCETTTGMLNPIHAIGKVVKAQGKSFIVDAMSSFGGVPIDMVDANIDFLVSSANKCIHGVPGFGFIIAKRPSLMACEGVARSLSLDIFSQWKTMEVDGKWRFTSPTHVVAAFYEALGEMQEMGGVRARYLHYNMLNTYLRSEMVRLGFHPYIEEEVQSPIITTFYYPEGSFQFAPFYEAMKEKGFILYPGKLTDVDTFRIGNIGDIVLEDMKRLVNEIECYMNEKVLQK